MHGINAELITEFAKDKVWEDSLNTLQDQIYIFGKQYHRLWRLLGKVEYVVCDSPLINSIIYDKSGSQEFHNLVLSEFKKFKNINLFIRRGLIYQSNGRLESESKAIEIDNEIKNLLNLNNIEFNEISQDDISLQFLIND